MKIITNAPGQVSALRHLEERLEHSTDVACLSGYVSADALYLLDISQRGTAARVRILVGMASQDGLLAAVKSTFAKFDKSLATANGGGIRITREPSHAKYWLGRRGGGEWTILGSSNLSRQGLYERREANVLDEHGALFGALEGDFEALWADSLPVDSAPVRLLAPKEPLQDGAAVAAFPALSDEEVASVKISLVDKRGEVQGGDGLNWWRNARTGAVRRARPDEACIPIRQSNAAAIKAVLGELHQGLVLHAVVSTGESFDLVLQGEGAGGNAKQIASKGDLQILGRWILREILDLPPGTRVTAKILRDRVGTTAITVTKLGLGPDGILHVYLAFDPES